MKKVRGCDTPNYWFLGTRKDANCFDLDWHERVGGYLANERKRNTDACNGCKHNETMCKPFINNLVVNDCGVVIEGYEVIIDYVSKDYRLMFKIADFGGFWGVGYSFDDKATTEGGGSGVSEIDIWLKLITRDDVIKYLEDWIKKRVPERKQSELNKLINNIKTPQLTLF